MIEAYVAWRNTIQNKVQTAAAVAGVSFAVFLLFMQLGIYRAAERNATLITSQLDFDLILFSPHYQFILQPGSLPRPRVYQARGVEGVASVVPVYAGSGRLRNVDSQDQTGITAIAIDPADRPFLNDELNSLVGGLTIEDTALMDRQSRPECGPRVPGTVTELAGRRLTIIGNYEAGTGLIGNGTLLLSDRTFVKIVPGASAERVALGLVKLRPGVRLDEAEERLGQMLGPSVGVMTRDRFERRERRYLLGVRPVGILFTLGLGIGFAVGAVTFYQVLEAETANRQLEFATFKALGFTNYSLYRTLVLQAMLLTGCAFAPAFVLALGLFQMLRDLAQLPMRMTPGLVGTIIALTLGMSTSAAALVLRRIHRVNPADLFP